MQCFLLQVLLSFSQAWDTKVCDAGVNDFPRVLLFSSGKLRAVVDDLYLEIFIDGWVVIFDDGKSSVDEEIVAVEFGDSDHPID